MLLHPEALSRNSSTPRAVHTLLRLSVRAALLLVSILVLLNSSADLRAQDAPAPDDPEVVRVRTDLVTIPLFVADRNNRPVLGLTLKDFGATVDGRNLRLEYFAAGTERVALAFALDASGSTREIIGRQSRAALALFARFGPQSSVAVWRFGTQPQLIAGFTTDDALVRPAFNPGSATDERTAIFDAALAAVRAFERKDADPAERRILILISDGLDTASRTKAPTVITEAVQRAVSIYVIHLPLFAPRDGRLEPRPAAKGFRTLAAATGGRYFMIGDASAALDPRAEVDLSPVFKAIEEDLQGQYVLGLYPDEASRDGRFHRLSISLNAPHNRQLRVRQLRDGYTIKQ